MREDSIFNMVNVEQLFILIAFQTKKTSDPKTRLLEQIQYL